LGRRFVVGDIHGAHKALRQVLERSHFDYDNDFLVIIGDVCDGYPETKECVDELLKIKNRVFVVGNHDLWFVDWIKTGDKPPIWTNQGGEASLESYGHSKWEPRIIPDIPDNHRDFWLNYVPYYLTKQNKLFVHGGFKFKTFVTNGSLVAYKAELYEDLDKQGPECLAWDRDLFGFTRTRELRIGPFEEIFIGHTSTESFSLDPVHRCNVWNVDQGAGWGGRLTLLDIDSKEFWSSDKTKELYDGFGR